MANLDDVLKLKAKQAKLRSEADQAKGMLASLQKTLKDDWGCSSISQATEKLRKMEAEENRLQESFSRKLGSFTEEWKDVLDRVG